MVAYYFSKKSAKLDKNGTAGKVVKILRIVFFATLPVFFGLILYQAIFYSLRKHSFSNNVLCKTPVFIIPESVNFIVAMIFAFATYRITQSLKAYVENLRIMQDYSLENIDLQTKNEKDYKKQR